MTNNEMIHDEKTPGVSPGNYSPVTIYNRDTVGAVFLGILSLIFLIAWLRSERRYRGLIASRNSVEKLSA